MEGLRPSSSSGRPSRDRRRAPRVEVLGQLHGAIVALRMSVTVRDASPGGFSIETALPFPDGAEHQFRFTTGQGDEAVVTARSVYTRPAESTGDAPSYLTGFEFVMQNETDHREVAALVEALTGALAG